MTVIRFEELSCWQTARALTRSIYDQTNQGTFARDFGLRDQIRRASVSVMSNIAEGFESRTRNLFMDYLGRAKASAGEVRCQLYIARDVGYLDELQFTALYDLSDKVIRQLYKLIMHLRTHPGHNRIHDTLSDYSATIDD